MHFLTKKTIARRTFLQGMGAAIALPYLDAMIPVGRTGGAAVDSALHRESRPGRRLLLQLRLRVHRHHQLGVAE